MLQAEVGLDCENLLHRLKETVSNAALLLKLIMRALTDQQGRGIGHPGTSSAKTEKNIVTGAEPFCRKTETA